MDALNQRRGELRAELEGLEAKSKTLSQQKAHLSAELAALHREVQGEQQVIRQSNAAALTQDQKVICQSNAKYLQRNGQIDTGSLKLFWNRIEYKGWRGNASILLSSVTSVDSGTSRVQSRTGLPVLGSRWPGETETRQTVIIAIADGGGRSQRAVFLHLPEAKDWFQQLNDTVSGLSGQVASRAETQQDASNRNQRIVHLNSQFSEKQRALNALHQQIRLLDSTKNAIKGKLSLSDWENKTIKVSGKNLQKQLNQRLEKESRDGWELVSSSSPKNDEIIASLRRVRRL